MLKVGVIGLGVGAAHAASFAADKHCEVVALCDIDSGKREWAAETFPEATVFADADKMLSTELDIAVVAGFDDSHCAQVVQALNNGMHVFVEKPVCLFEAEALQIKKALDKSSKCISSNLCLRSVPLFESVKTTVQSGSMGKIFHLEGDYLWGRLHKLDGGWRSKMDFYSITYGAAIHMIDLLMWIMEEKVVEVFAYGNDLSGRAIDFPFDDFSVLVMKFESGATAKVSANGGCVHPHFHKLEVFGTEKTFSHSLSGSKWIESRDGDVPAKEASGAYPAREYRWRVVSTFVEHILNENTKPLVGSGDVFDTMSVCFAADRSLRSGSKVLVEYL